MPKPTHAEIVAALDAAEVGSACLMDTRRGSACYRRIAVSNGDGWACDGCALYEADQLASGDYGTVTHIIPAAALAQFAITKEAHDVQL